MGLSGFACLACAVCAGAMALLLCLRLWMRRRDIHVFKTMAGRTWVVPSYDSEGMPTRVLRVGGGNQSATYIDDELWAVPPSAYIRKFDLIFDAEIPVRNVLMLGGGGYSYPKLLISAHPEARIDVVEVDPQITSIARRFFYLDRLIVEFETEQTGRLGIFTQDARSFLEASEAVYDAVVNDTFSGKEPAYELMTVEALALVRRHLRPGGRYVTNVVAPLEGAGCRILHETVENCRQVFSQVSVVSCSPGGPRQVDNRLVVASDAPQVPAASGRCGSAVGSSR